MSQVRNNPIPLPAALLALSVAVCLGATGPVDASTLRSSQATQAEQREALEHLLDALQQAAKRLTHKLDGKAAFVRCDTAWLTPINATPADLYADVPTLVDLHLREALLNLPPPVC